MHGLRTIEVLNTEATIRAIIQRATDRGVKLTRAEVLDELKWRDNDDTTVWSATVDRMLGVQS